jgi:hypothetical protein
MRRFFDRYAIWIAVLVPVVGALLRQDWWLLGVAAVGLIGFGVLRPLDKRANRQIREES